MKALDKWANVSKTIFKQDKDKLRKLLFSINGEMYIKLQKFAQSLTSPNRKKQLNLVNSALKCFNSDNYLLMKEGLENLERALQMESECITKYSEINQDEKHKRNLKIVKKQSIITPLMMVKRGLDGIKTVNSRSSKRTASVIEISDVQNKANKALDLKTKLSSGVSSIPKLIVTNTCVNENKVVNQYIQSSDCDKKLVKSTSTSLLSAVESTKCTQIRPKSQISNFKTQKISGTCQNSEESYNSLSSISDSSENSLSSKVSANSLMKNKYTENTEKRVSTAQPQYSKEIDNCSDFSKSIMINSQTNLFKNTKKMCPNTLVLLNEISKLKAKNCKLMLKYKAIQ